MEPKMDSLREVPWEVTLLLIWGNLEISWYEASF